MNVGVDDVSRKIIKTNVGVDDISRKCIRGFIGSDAPIGVDDANTKLLLHAESFTDESIYNIPVTNNGATISSAQSKFGGKSFYFDGNANIAIPHDTIIFSDEDFTIDWWEYVNATNKHQVFHQKSVANTAVGFLIGLNALYISSGSGVWDIASGVSLGDKLTKQWVHRAIVRKGDKFYIFQNGILKNTCTSNKAISASGNPTIGVYHYTTTDYYMDGYIDEFRISDIAQWTEDFIPPNQPYHVLKYGVARELFVADVTYARHYVKDTWLQLTPDTGDAYDYDYWTTSDIAIPVDGSNNWDFVNAQSTGMLWPYPEKGSADFAAWENVIDKAKKDTSLQMKTCILKII